LKLALGLAVRNWGKKLALAGWTWAGSVWGSGNYPDSGILRKCYFLAGARKRPMPIAHCIGAIAGHDWEFA